MVASSPCQEIRESVELVARFDSLLLYRFGCEQPPLVRIDLFYGHGGVSDSCLVDANADAATPANVPGTIAAVLLEIRNQTGVIPDIYFEWTEGNPIRNMVRFLVTDRGEIAPVTREVLRESEADPRRRPAIHVSEIDGSLTRLRELPDQRKFS